MAEPSPTILPVELHVAEVEQKARALAAALLAAREAGTPDVLILPKLVEVFRDAGMLP